jgi:menaquinone-specific isochorismate synthase
MKKFSPLSEVFQFIFDFAKSCQNESSVETRGRFRIIEKEISQNLSLTALLPYLSDCPLFFYQSREKNQNEDQYLGIGICYKKDQFKNDLKPENYPTSFVVFRFDETRPQDNEWSDIDDNQLIVPRLLIFRKKQKLMMRLHYQINEDINLIIQDFSTYFTLPKETPLCSIAEVFENCAQDLWNKSINHGLTKIENGEIQKVVLARKEIFHLKNINANQLLVAGLHLFSDCYIYLYRPSKSLGFLSFTPEKLFSLENEKISTDAIAGTRARGFDSKSDYELTQDLLQNSKELIEHELVCIEIENKLKKLKSIPLCTQKLGLLKLTNVQHLHSTYEAILSKDNFPGLYSLVRALHPTPAVGGYPWDKARSVILENEAFDRGLYAAPVGIMSADKMEFLVGIRSALINEDKNEIQLFAGVGVVEGSQSEQEWIETKNKLKNFYQILGHNQNA